jgi:hypothetical protein
MHLPHWLQQIQTHIESAALLFAYSVWEYWLGKTEKLVAASTWELIYHGMLWLKERTIVCFRKLFP